MKLLLDKDINTDFVRYKVARRLERNPHPYKNFEEFLVDVYIHEYSNYEDLMWSFWKRDREFCLKEMDSLLMQISNIDRELTRLQRDMRTDTKNIITNLSLFKLEKI